MQSTNLLDLIETAEQSSDPQAIETGKAAREEYYALEICIDRLIGAYKALWNKHGDLLEPTLKEVMNGK